MFMVLSMERRRNYIIWIANNYSGSKLKGLSRDVYIEIRLRGLLNSYNANEDVLNKSKSVLSDLPVLPDYLFGNNPSKGLFFTGSGPA